MKLSHKVFLLALLCSWVVSVSAQTPIQKLIDQFGSTQEEPLPPDQAFQLDMRRDSNGNFELRWDISKDYYLYRDKIKVVYFDAELKVNKPTGETISDEFFGTTQVYRYPMATPARFSLPDDGQANLTNLLHITYQGCADLGICYPPTTKILALSDIPLTSLNLSGPVANNEEVEFSVQDKIVNELSTKSLGVMVLIFLGFGLLLALTPCVLPMVPIVSGMIIGSQNRSATRAFLLTSVYVLAMASTYAVFGVIVGLGGANVQVWFQQPAVIAVFVAIFVLLAASMFGLFELRMPSKMQMYFSQMGSKQRGQYFGAALMGSGSALIVAPCITPPLVGALLFIAQTGDAITGAVVLFSLGLGMGVPLWIIGTSMGKWLPKPGLAMKRINALFGLLLLGVAVWMLDRVVPETLTLLLGGLLLVGGGIYLFSMSGKLLLWRGFAVTIILYGVLILFGTSVGSGSFLSPLAPFMQTTEKHEELPFKQIEKLAELEATVSEASLKQQWSMLDFYADWCVSCKEMETFTFSKKKVHKALNGFVLMQVDVTENNAEHQRVLKHFGLYGPPAILFFGPDGKERRSARLVGFVSEDDFLRHLARLQERG